MKVSSVNSSLVQKNNVSFQGMAKVAPSRIIRTAQDAIAQWNVLKHPQFTNIFQESEIATAKEVLENQKIRDLNYSFLDSLYSTAEKSKFIEYFKRITGFPSLAASSRIMLAEFERVLKTACRKAGGSADDVLLSGYDRYCSVGLGTALPGSDLDKGYAIVKGVTGGLSTQQKFSERLKGFIWENIDNRLMSVNHCAAFPNIMTDKELVMSLDKFEPYAKEVVGTDARYNLFLRERMENPNPVSSAKFNIWLSQILSSKKDKADAKNLAYVVETIRDGEKASCNYDYMEQLTDKMNNSYFSWCTNVGQGHVMDKKYSYYASDVTKPKLKARKDIENNFNSWSVNKQYELVKDIIRSMSGDNKNPEFKNLFYSKTDRHRLLINDILNGDVDCAFDFNKGSETFHCFPKTPETIERYYDFNIYKMD